MRYPVLGALYHPPGAIARHDAVAWGYAKGATMRGVEIHTQTEVTGILIENGQAARASRPIAAPSTASRAMQAVAGSSSLVAKLAGFRLPIRTIPLQACVSEPLKPFLDQIVVSGSLHIYISQSARGEFVMGGSTDPYALYSHALDARLQGRPARPHARAVPVPRQGHACCASGPAWPT